MKKNIYSFYLFFYLFCTFDKNFIVNFRDVRTKSSSRVRQQPMNMTPHNLKQLTLFDFFKRIMGFREAEDVVITTEMTTPTSQVFSIPNPADCLSDSFYDKIKVKRRLFEDTWRPVNKRPRLASSSSTADNEPYEVDGRQVDDNELRVKLAKEESKLFRIEGYLSRIDHEKEMWLLKQKRVKRTMLKLKWKIKNNIRDGENSWQSKSVAEEEYDFETEALDDTESD